MTSHKPVRILLSEGSSLSARETLTALGLAGYEVDVCDPNPLCLGRVSRFVHHFYRCPALGEDPAAYLQFILQRLDEEHYDVLLPVHEQAFLFARVREQLQARVGLAVADFPSFLRLQGKISFVRLLEELDLPHPPSEVVHSERGLRARRRMPFFVKAEYGTAESGVWRVDRADDLDRVAATLKSRGLLNRENGVVVQEAEAGALERAQAVCDAGRLVALHTYRQRREGPRGGDVAKVSVRRPDVRADVARIGEQLHWHGALSLDYLFDEESGPSFIDSNPRIVEPMNALFSGIDLAGVLVRISLGEPVEPLPPGREGVRTHLALMALLEEAIESGSRIGVLGRLGEILLGWGEYADSREELTPVRLDPPSVIPVIAVLTRLLLNPGSAPTVAGKAVTAYSLTAKAVRAVIDMGARPRRRHVGSRAPVLAAHR